MFGLDSLFGGGGGGGGSSFSGGGIGNSESNPMDSHADNSLNAGNNSILATLKVGDGSTVNTSDLGAIGQAFDFARFSDATLGQGFDSMITASSAGVHDLVGAQSSGLAKLVSAQSDGFSNLLGTMADLFTLQSDNNTKLAGQTEQAVMTAYTNAASDKTSTIDNRTIIVLALAGVAAIFVLSRMSKG